MKKKGSILSPILIVAVLVIVLLITGTHGSSSGGSVLASTLGSIAKILLWAAVLILILLVVFVVVVIISVSRDSKNAEAKPSGKDDKTQVKDESGRPLTADEQAALKKGAHNLLELRKLGTSIRDAGVKRGSSEICKLFERTLQILRQKPDQITNARQCLNYYIPTFGEILEKYQRLESNGALTEDMNAKVMKYLEDIKAALDTLNTKLFENDKLDMSVEMKAMRIAFQRDGLVDDKMGLTDLKL
ncbi:MAG: 5-bromo-4-chloroindolyl phosphate hydrolysis family protein [Clostridia bacterium]|nr:5-bromo-4-chloroindolyl phosphate hydrolysis family protein [Clostridia bacterium]